MGFFNRRRESEPDGPVPPPADPDPALPALDRADAAALTTLARDAFAQAGRETTPDGAGALTAMDGTSYGLTNLSIRAAGTPRGDWPSLVAEHARAMVASDGYAEPQSFADVRDQVLPRLRLAAHLPSRPAGAREIFPGLVELIAIDYPTFVKEMHGDDQVERLGGWDVLRAAAMGNLRALDPLVHETLSADDDRSDALVHILKSDDVFGPSRLLDFVDAVVGRGVPASQHGHLIAMPDRHLVAVHPITGAGVVPALHLLARLAQGEFDSQPGGVSPYVYYRPSDGTPSLQVTRPGEEGAIKIVVEDALAACFADLGLLE